MFDAETSTLLRSAPPLEGLDPETLPQILTTRFTDLVTRRLRQAEDESAHREQNDPWPLSRIADTYELIVSTTQNQQHRRAAAFVAATAQQILSQAQENDPTQNATTESLTRDSVHPQIASAILFLAAEQFADANEAAQRIQIDQNQEHTVTALLAQSVRDLAMGKLGAIVTRAESRSATVLSEGHLEDQSVSALFESVLVGVELYASEMLGSHSSGNTRFNSARDAFSRVLALSSNARKTARLPGQLLTTYPGPRHLAALLLNAYDATKDTAVIKIPPPSGVDVDFWHRWLRHRADLAPFTWPNHRPAIAKNFHAPGHSALLVLPTGAGKTTVSCLKIAATLGAGKTVIFIAPTHALVEQLTADLQVAFPASLIGRLVSKDFDRLFADASSIRSIEVMTPEHCLSLLSYAPEVLEDVGLMVFDECHLLSPESGLRRALDGMFCVLAFNQLVPNADFLFLSAMIHNGEDFSAWIESLTDRRCIFVNPLWKPSRQARGIVFYREEELHENCESALHAQQSENRKKGKIATTLRKVAREHLTSLPYGLFGLHHNWLSQDSIDCRIAQLLNDPVPLTGTIKGNRVLPKPNVNVVAGHLASRSCLNGLKTIVFVNTKNHAVTTARLISQLIESKIQETPDEQQKWAALDVELGGNKHSLLDGPSVAVPHNADMLRIERELAEQMFRRPDGAQTIVATPTLAQGLNLPAHIAILAGDMRASPETSGREPLKAHEILNAAARAGRAGHLANGVVLLIPEQILTFRSGNKVGRETVERLRAILPEDDRCITMSDPLQHVLDRITVDASDAPEVEYSLNRLATAVAPDGVEPELTTHVALNKSFAAYIARQRGDVEAFESKTKRLKDILAERNTGAEDRSVIELAAQSGAPVSVLNSLRDRMARSPDPLPTTFPDWIRWIFSWLEYDENARYNLLQRDQSKVLSAVGRKTTDFLSPDAVRDLEPGVLAWIHGDAVRDIDIALGGDPDAASESQRKCPRARTLVTGIIPLSLSFVAGIVARSAETLGNESAVPPVIIACLPTAVRRGFDSPWKLAFSDAKPKLSGRVEVHREYSQAVTEEPTIDLTMDYQTVQDRLRSLLD